MKQLMVSESWLYRHRFVFGYSLLAILGIFALFYRLGDLLPGINWYEANSASISMDIGSLLSNPIDFIFHSLQFISISLLGPSAFAIRLPGVILTILALGLFFYVLDHRFTKRAAVITTLLFVTSSWLLNSTRLGGPMSLTILMVLLLLFASTRLDKQYHVGWLVGLAIIAALSLYSPYFIYLLVAGVILSIPTIRKRFKEIKNRDLYITGGVFVVLIAPLIYTVVRDVSIAKQLLAIPETFPSPAVYLQNIIDVIGHVIWSSEPLEILHLGSLPMLEIFSVSMVALGLYHYDHELSRNLSRLLLGGLTILVFVLAISANQLDYAILLPFVYFILTGGLVILFAQWNEIFPKNPLARLIAIVPISLLLIIVISYHGERYFVAWPNSPEVVAVHSEAYTELLDKLNENSAYTVVLNTDAETKIMAPLKQYFEEVLFVSDIQQVESSQEERRLIITNKAYKQLDDDTRKMLGTPTSIVPSHYNLNPTVLWVYGVSI